MIHGSDIYTLSGEGNREYLYETICAESADRSVWCRCAHEILESCGEKMARACTVCPWEYLDVWRGSRRGGGWKGGREKDDGCDNNSALITTCNSMTL